MLRLLISLGNSFLFTMNYLTQYREAIRRGEIRAGYDMIDELDRLIADLDDPQYRYDTAAAELRIDFIENCVKLTKAPFYGKPMKLLLWEKAFIEVVYSFEIHDIDSGEWVQRFQEILLLICRKNGKALSLDTPIPTPNGWKTMGDIKKGDYVFGRDGKPTKVLDTFGLFYKPMYRVTFEDGTTIKACKDHLWTVQTKCSRRACSYVPTSDRKLSKPEYRDNNGWYETTTEEISKDFARVRADGKGTEYKYRVPLAEAVEYPHKDLPLDPYTLGVWLGYGCKNHTGITCSDIDRDEMIKNLTEQGHVCKWTKSPPHAGTIWIDTLQPEGNKTLEALKKISVYKNKHIPEMYMFSSIEQRRELLMGLMDTDGTCNKAGQCEFTQKNKDLAYQVVELVRSLGIKATINEKNAKCNGKDCGIVYRIRFYVDKQNSCFKLKRKHERLKEHLADRMKAKSIVNVEPIPIEPSKCIAVDNTEHLYLAGDYTTTHNTELIAALLLTELIIGGVGIDIVCSGMDDGTADLCYTAIDTMRLLIDPKSVDTWRNQKGIKCFANNNHIYKLANSTRQREGRNIDIAALDEVWSLPADGDIYKSIQQSTSVKDSYKIFMFGSEGFVADGFLDRKRTEYTAIVRGEDDSEVSKRKLPWIYTQDSEQEVWDTNADGINPNWEKSNPSIGTIKKWTYLRDRVEEARASKVDRVFVLSKDFNFKQSAAAVWLGTEDYTYAEYFEPDEFMGALCLGAVDMSETTDMTSARVVVMRAGDPHKYIIQHYWIPESKLDNSDDKQAGAHYADWAREGKLTICEGNDIDLTLVADWFYKLYCDYGLRLYKCGYDVKFSKDFLRRMDEYGFDCEMVIQNAVTLSNAMKLCEADFKAQLIRYNQNPVDRWCLGNAGMQADKYGNCMAVKIQPSMRIDGAVTFIILYEMIRRYRTDFKAAVK